jgi:Right handed beta helix region
MLDLLNRRCLLACALLFLFATSSAYAARPLHREISRAGHRTAGHPRRSRRRHASTRSDSARRASTLSTTSSSGSLIGEEALEPQTDYVEAGQSEAFRLQARVSGASGAVHVYIAPHSASSILVVGLYANLGRHPGALLSSGSIASPQAGSWNTVPVTRTSLVSGSSYWLAILGSGGTLRYRDHARGSCPSETSAQSTLQALPSSWSTGTVYSDCPVSAYVTPASSIVDPVEPVIPTETTPPSTGSTPPLETTSPTTTTTTTATSPTESTSTSTSTTTIPTKSTSTSSSTTSSSSTITSSTATTSTASTTSPTETTSTSTATPTESTTTTTTTTTTETDPPPPPSTEACTATVSSVAQVNADIKPGAVVCLTAGSYGSLTLTASPSSPATVTAAPGAHVVVAGVQIDGQNLTVSQLYSTAGINVGTGGGHDTIEHNDVTDPKGYGISVLPNSGVDSYITISGNKVHETSITGEGDALRFDGWSNITVTGNDIYDIHECASGTCHTDCLQSYQADVPTTGLVFSHNYIHDNSCEGPPFLKDGDISNVTITDNLDVRNTGKAATLFVDDNTVGLVIRNNTYQETTGSCVQSEGSAANPTVAIDHNVFDQLNVPSGAYKVTEDYDIFTANNEWTFNLGPHSSLNSHPEFVDTSTDDYRLAKNPYGIGVDWSPAEEQYGPTS